MHLECFTTGATLDFHLVWRYHPATNTLSSRYDNGVRHHLAPTRATAPPSLNLRVNYGHDWVENFYEAEHKAWITVTDGDSNVKVTAEAVTDSSGYFQTQWSDWLNGNGDPMESPPDIQPYDWVYGWTTAQALDFREFTPSKGSLKAREVIRKYVDHLEVDRPLV